MKKRVLIVLALVLIPVLLAGCGKKADSKAVGDWTLCEVGSSGLSLDPATLGMELTMSLKSGGKAVMTNNISDDPTPQEGTWSVSGNEITVISGGQTVKLTMEGEYLTCVSEGMAMKFRRK